MTTSVPRRSADRDRAVGRLRSLTIGTGIASIAAVGGFGAVAAVSNAGSSTGLPTAARVTTTAAHVATTTSTTSTTSTPTSAPTRNQQAIAAPAATVAPAHVATGSS